MKVIEGAFEYRIDGNECIVTKCIHPDYYLSIPKYIKGKPVRQIAANAFSNCKNIAAIVLPSTLSHIQEGAFAQSDVSTIERKADSGSPTLYVNKFAFYECDKLTEVKFGGKTFLESSGYQFKGCCNLSKIDSLSIYGAIPKGAFLYTNLKLFCFNDSTYVAKEAFLGTPLERVYVQGKLKYSADFLKHREKMEIVCEKTSPILELAYEGFNVKVKQD